jgi:hypothetical protein
MLKACKQIVPNKYFCLPPTLETEMKHTVATLSALVRNIHHTRLVLINPFINATGICGIAIQKLGQHFSKGRLFDASTAPLGVYSVCQITFCIAWSEQREVVSNGAVGKT